MSIVHISTLCLSGSLVIVIDNIVCRRAFVTRWPQGSVASHKQHPSESNTTCPSRYREMCCSTDNLLVGTQTWGDSDCDSPPPPVICSDVQFYFGQVSAGDRLRGKKEKKKKKESSRIKKPNRVQCKRKEKIQVLTYFLNIFFFRPTTGTIQIGPGTWNILGVNYHSFFHFPTFPTRSFLEQELEKIFGGSMSLLTKTWSVSYY